ncbi:asparaginase [Cytophagales bacterium LB-30]|uniref:asparaginase n=1 Tax=Shiella aurantiaca TaxID=3058365 RepID=A0ABT8F1Q9_9BACT|nr:asparaginase [Shiella aurantiaca]MDN4164386.1 asparaginase [Shiella aurantiaca]
MKNKIIHINTAAPKPSSHSILIIYTGGTMGMVYDESGALVPFDFQLIMEEVPSLRNLQLNLTVIAFEELIDSSDMNPDHWVAMARIIKEYYESYDGFLILHGTDTMAYTASALSFMLEGLSKPVILTGAQLPIGASRSDARENIITALEITSAKKNGKPIVQEVCIFFDRFLLRGNRAKKVESSHFDAFHSENYPNLAEAGIYIEYNEAFLGNFADQATLTIQEELDSHVTILKLFPGINEKVVEGTLNVPGLRAVVLETFGAGNAPTAPWFLAALRKAIEKGIIIYNVSQCVGGKVLQGRYKTSQMLDSIGVIGGNDSTTEAAVTKLMYLLGKENSVEAVKEKLKFAIRGEMQANPSY